MHSPAAAFLRNSCDCAQFNYFRMIELGESVDAQCVLRLFVSTVGARLASMMLVMLL